MKVNKSTTIVLTNKELEDIICEHIEKQGYNVDKIKFNVIEHTEKDPVDDRYDIVHFILNGCTITYNE